MIRFLFDPFNQSAGYRGSGFISAGIILLLIGLIILIFPEILIAFIASLFIVGGISSLFFGWKIRKSKEHYHKIEIN